MGNTKSLLELRDDEIQAISVETEFSRSQILRLYVRFLSLDKKGNGFLSREDFLRIPELAINPLGDRIIDGFLREAANGKGNINFREFAKVLAHFRPMSKGKRNNLNNRMAKLKFAFSMYDMNKNGFITREEFKMVLSKVIGANVTSEQLESIVDRTIAEADIDNDGKISFDEFCRAMEKTDIEHKMSIRFLS